MKKHFAIMRWYYEDLEEALLVKGFEPSDENIEKLLNNRLSRTVEEYSVASGWEIINDVIGMTDDLVAIERKSKKEIAEAIGKLLSEREDVKNGNI